MTSNTMLDWVLVCACDYGCNQEYNLKDNLKQKKYLAENVSNVGILGGNLTVKMREKSDNIVYLRRFPDGRSQEKNFTLPLHFNKLEQTHNALYIAGGEYDKGQFERESAYFEIIVKECPDNRFGKDCKNICNCDNNGVCHSVIGSCVALWIRLGLTVNFPVDRNILETNFHNIKETVVVSHFACLSHLDALVLLAMKDIFAMSYTFPIKRRKRNKYKRKFIRKSVYLLVSVSNLTFPYLNQYPSVKMTSDSVIEIQFDEWKEGQEGFTYGLQISSYSIYIGN
ncbi:hypothetical protein Anas_04334, partial [Armadillidium nasatum]